MYVRTAVGAAATLAVAGLAYAGAGLAQTPAPQPKGSPSQPTSGTPPAAKSQAAAPVKLVEPGQLQPHRAVYDINLDTSRKATSVTEMTGRMVYELTGSPCDGWTQSMRFVSRMTDQEGGQSVTDMRSSSWEDAAAQKLKFESSQYRDGKHTESTTGEVARDAMGAEGTVELSKPAKKEFKLKPETYFPVHHSIALLAAARRGETVFIGDLYDGSEKGEKVYATTTYIGKERPKGHNRTLPPVPSADPLDGMRSWPVSISYFEAGSDAKDAVPSYELAFVYFENGVSRRLFIDYGDFAIRGNLRELTFHEPGKCERKP